MKANLVEVGNLVHPWGVLVLGGPAGKEFRALLLYLRVREGGSAAETQALKECLIGEVTLKMRAGILDQAVEQGQGSELAM